MIRRITQFGVIALLSTAGLLTAATAASAHANSVTGIVTCSSSPGNAHYNIVWTISNNYDLSEIATVTGVTGGPTTVIGLGGIQPPFVSIGASPDQNDESTGIFTQTLPWTAAGTSAYLTVGGVWSDGYTGAATGTVAMPTSCVPAPIPLVITASSPSTIYGAPVPPVLASFSGFTGGDSASSLATPPTCTTTAMTSSPVGTYPTSCSGAVDAKYAISYVPGTLTVLPAPLVVTASSISMSAGAGVPQIAASFSGFVMGDRASSLTSSPTCVTTATSSSGVGNYPTFCSGAFDVNYIVTYIPGTLTVIAASPVTAAAPTPSATTPPSTIAPVLPAVLATRAARPSGRPGTAVSAATAAHTGEPWAGTSGLEEGLGMLGLCLVGLGELRRRRWHRVGASLRPNGESRRPPR